MNNRAREKMKHHYTKAQRQPTMIKNLINRIRIYQKGIAIKKISNKKDMKDERL